MFVDAFGGISAVPFESLRFSDVLQPVHDVCNYTLHGLPVHLAQPDRPAA